MKEVIKAELLTQEETLLLGEQCLLKSIDGHLIGYSSKGLAKLMTSTLKILDKCQGRDRSEQLMTKDAFYLNPINELIVVLYNASSLPFIVLNCNKDDFYIQ